MRIGYTIILPGEQKNDVEIAALKKAKCDHIYMNKSNSKTVFDSKELDKVVTSMQQGDTLIIWRLDRIGKTLIGLIEFLAVLAEQGIELISLSENIDTSSTGNQFVFHLMTGLAEFERSMISERTRAGLQAAREKGKKLGRPSSFTSEQAQEIKHAILVEKEKVGTIAQKYGVSYRTIMRLISKEP